MAKHVMIPTEGAVKMAVGATEPADWAVVQDWKCQITLAQMNPETRNVTTPPNWCGDPETDHPQPSKWAIQLDGLQDWNADANSISEFLFDNETSVGWVQLVSPDNTGSGNDISTLTAKVTFVAGAWGGAAGQPSTFSVTLPALQKPTTAKSTVA